MLLVGTMLGGPLGAGPALSRPPEASPVASPAAMPAPPSSPAAAAPAEAPPASVPSAATSGILRGITIKGTERLEPETVKSYIELNVGDTYDRESEDKALKALYASELFSDATIQDVNGTLVVTVKEAPVINRILIEGAKRSKED